MTSELSDQQIKELKSVLEARRRELLEEIRAELVSSDDEHFQDLAGRVYDVGEASVADLLSDLNLAVIDQRIDELRDTESALERIAEGTYGSCVVDGAPIGYERLKAYPTASRCLEHQEQYEKTHAGEQAPRL